jgi:hypothetical protein
MGVWKGLMGVRKGTEGHARAFGFWHQKTAALSLCESLENGFDILTEEQSTSIVT